MKTLEEIFYSEFNQMVNKRRANTQNFSLSSLPLPQMESEISTRDMVHIGGIAEEYYNLLNNTDNMLWSHGKLSRRTYDYKGEFIKDKDGNYVVQGVTLPNDCVAILSDTKLCVPNSFRSKEAFEYVDYVQRATSNGGIERKYVYIIPREYCYKLNQTALVLSLTKLRNYYSGSSVILTNGYTVYMYVIPYKPRNNRMHNYRVLCTKCSLDYGGDIGNIIKLWSSKGLLFPYESCALYEGVAGKSNVAYEIFPDTIETFERYNQDVSMSKVEDDLDNLWEGNYDE